MSAGSCAAMNSESRYLEMVASDYQRTRNTAVLLGLNSHQLKTVMESVRGVGIPRSFLDRARMPLVLRIP